MREGETQNRSMSEFTVKVRAKSSALEIAEIAVVPSGWSRVGKDEEGKLTEILWTRCQKSRNDLELIRF